MTATKMMMTRPELEAIGAAVVQDLGGTWSNGRGMCRCPVHADRSPSLSIRVGRTRLLFHCFAGCDTAAILRWLRDVHPGALKGAPPARIRPQRSAAWLRMRVGELWDEARPILRTPAERYLNMRGLDAASTALRYHPRTPLGRHPSTIFRPALIAAVREGSRLVAVHRTFLDARGGAIAADLEDPRMMLGRPLAGAVQLARPGRRLGLAEGIETASSAITLLGFPVWAVLGSERLHQISIPAGVEELVLLADNDDPGRRAERLARETYAARSVMIHTHWPWGGLKDWNDVLRRCARSNGCDQRELVRSMA